MRRPLRDVVGSTFVVVLQRTANPSSRQQDELFRVPASPLKATLRSSASERWLAEEMVGLVSSCLLL